VEPIIADDKVESKVVPLRPIEAHLDDRRYSSCSFLTSALEGGEWSASRPGPRFTPGERAPGTHCTGGWVGPRAGMDTEGREKILCLCLGSNPGRPVRSQTLYWLSYRAHIADDTVLNFKDNIFFRDIQQYVTNDHACDNLLDNKDSKEM
jgi:hypothetical protein